MNDKYNDYELLYLISEGSEEAEEIIYMKYSPLIKKRVNAFRIQSRYRDDFYQEGLMCLNEAIKSFDDHYNKSFNKFFDMILQRRFIALLKKDQDYFYGVTLVEDYNHLIDRLEEERKIEYESTFLRIEDYKEELDINCDNLKDKIKILMDKNIKARDIALLLSCDVKKVYNEVYLLKNKTNEENN